MTEMSKQVTYRQITAADSAAVIRLANEVHGDNYLTEESFSDYLNRAQVEGVNLNWLAYLSEGHIEGHIEGHSTKLVGVRITFAPGKWDTEDQCTPAAWGLATDRICYFKCSAVSETARGFGIGRGLLEHSITSAKTMGCQAGLAHIWKQSPNNSAFAYFSRCGGELVAEHKKRWYQLSVEEGYHCPVCDGVCYCTAAEMILRF